MATLYKRANPSQRRILRIVEGAVKNARDAHQYNTGVTDFFARSVAKRAAGTISAQWPELLAARHAPSDRAVGDSMWITPPSMAHSAKPSRRGAAQHSSRTPPSPFKLLYTRLGAMAGWARKAGHEGRASALADALRVIASVEAELRR